MMQMEQTGRQIELFINGKTKRIFVRYADTWLYVLRERLGLMGAKLACGNGDCGACTILMNGLPINACHMLAIEAVNHDILTIEGLLDPTVSNTFVDKWALQCGYCTPGFILNCHALLENKPDATDADIDEWLDSNICRCTGYAEIKEVVRSLLKERAQV